MDENFTINEKENCCYFLLKAEALVAVNTVFDLAKVLLAYSCLKSRSEERVGGKQ